MFNVITLTAAYVGANAESKEISNGYNLAAAHTYARNCAESFAKNFGATSGVIVIRSVVGAYGFGLRDASFSYIVEIDNGGTTFPTQIGRFMIVKPE